MRGGATRNRVVWDEPTLRAPHDQADKAARVRRMFDAIAPTYERVNSIFSAGRDRKWRQAAVDAIDARADDRVLDVACGTGDLTRAFWSGPDRPGCVVGCDFAAGMLSRASSGSNAGVRWVLGDALRLPFRSGCFTAVGCAFGVRNFQDVATGLREMHRVLRPGGRAVVLEFTTPRGRWTRTLYGCYCRVLMPIGATWLSRDQTGAYRYLPRSIESFVESRELAARLTQAGFVQVRARPMTMGIVTLFHALKAGKRE